MPSSSPSSSSSSAAAEPPPPPRIGRVVVLRRSAEGEESEGGALPFEAEELVFGRDEHADVRIRLAAVSRVAMRLTRCAASGRVLLHNTSSAPSQVALNGEEGAGRAAPAPLRHGDVFSIGGRAFRFDYGERRRSARGQKARVRAARARTHTQAHSRLLLSSSHPRTRPHPGTPFFAQTRRACRQTTMTT
jgi:hypothetical protein